MVESSIAGKSEKGVMRTSLSVEDLGQRLMDIWKLSSEKPVKDAIGMLMRDVMRSGKWEPIDEPQRPTAPPADV
jgi:hypothetical protein